VDVDLWWPHANLAVELDSYRFHATRREFQRDREKGNALAGRTTLLRFTWADVAHRTSLFVAQIASRLRTAETA
jgi:hypothetical protein